MDFKQYGEQIEAHTKNELDKEKAKQRLENILSIFEEKFYDDYSDIDLLFTKMRDLIVKIVIGEI